MDIQQVIGRSSLCLLSLLGLTLLASPVAAQVFDSGPSDPALFDTVINVPTDPNIGDDESIGSDGLTTQLNLSDGGDVGNRVTVQSGSEVNISGGEVGNTLTVASGGEVNISGGTTSSRLTAQSGSEVNISGGAMSGFFVSETGSVVNITGGSTDFPFSVGRLLVSGEVNISGEAFVPSVSNTSGSEVNISGGSVGTSDAASGSVVNVSGGSVDVVLAASGSEVNVSGGSTTLFAGSGSVVNLSVRDAFLDGVLVSGLSRDSAVTIPERAGVLAGWLADGSDFSFELNPAPVDISLRQDFFDPEATLTVTLGTTLLLGDVNLDSEVNFEDIPDFIVALSATYIEIADINQDYEVNFGDIAPFIEILTAQ